MDLVNVQYFVYMSLGLPIAKKLQKPWLYVKIFQSLNEVLLCQTSPPQHPSSVIPSLPIIILRSSRDSTINNYDLLPVYHPTMKEM